MLLQDTRQNVNGVLIGVMCHADFGAVQLLQQLACLQALSL